MKLKNKLPLNIKNLLNWFCFFLFAFNFAALGQSKKIIPQSVASGPGTVSLSPAVWKFDAKTNLNFVFKPAGGLITGIKIVKPNLFYWAKENVTILPGSANVNQSGDTLSFNNFSISGSDSIVINISNVTSSDSTDEFSIPVLTTSNGSIYAAVNSIPKTIVYGIPRSATIIKTKKTGGTFSYLGKWVAAKGIVTAANEFGGPSYLQDETAGFAVYDASVSKNVNIGDEIIVLGKVSTYNNLFELTPVSILEKTGENKIVTPLDLSISQINNQDQNGVEPYEGRLIRINSISKVLTISNSPASSWAVSGSGTNYNIFSNGETIQVRISPNVNLANRPVPAGNFDLIGVLGQYKTDYQLLPRFYQDVILESGVPQIISEAPYETEIKSNSITFSFQTDIPGSTIIRYGKTSAYGNIISDTNKVTNHSITLNGLEPATIYNVKISAANNGDTTSTQNYIVETSSQSSTGNIEVYFNYPVDTSVSTGEDAQKVSIVQQILRRINSAASSIDLALYSFSGGVGSNMAAALMSAKNRGVKVRVIGEYDNSTSAAWTTLKNSGIPVIFDNFGTSNSGDGLMHNKFAVFDNRDSIDTNDWVWSGSWNATDPGNSNDAQNAIAIQDEALANAYRIEFEEMWGSDNDTPNAANSKFGSDKTDNTPHKFNINGSDVELYFDPSDNANKHIGDALNSSTSSINVAMLTFTKSDLAQILVNKNNDGNKVHVIVDNNTDTGNQFNFMKDNGVDVLLKGDAVSGFLHHKYAVIDSDKFDADQIVITGSHNWTNAANTSNNENTLIIHSKRIANLYLQEFKARYIEAGGKDLITDTKEENDSQLPVNFELYQNYPNPFNPTTTIKYSIPAAASNLEMSAQNVTLKIFDMLGREIATLVNGYKSPGNYVVTFNASGLSSGIYFYQLRSGSYILTNKMMILK